MVRLRPFISPRIVDGSGHTIYVILANFWSLNGVYTAAAIEEAFTSLEKFIVCTKLADF